MNSTRIPPITRQSRRGVYAPVVAVVLLIVMAGLALILDRVWLETAQLELEIAAESAALAAAGQLADDQTLLEHPDWEEILARARNAASVAASENLAAGQPVSLATEPGEDIRFGRLATNSETGRTQFLEVTHAPTSVLVLAERLRSRGNPVALFLRTSSGLDAADVVARAEASILGPVVGVRPLPQAPAPGLPLAIQWTDPSGRSRETWQAAIELRQGPDRFGYDPVAREVIESPDGLPELTLRFSSGQDSGENAPNAQIIDLSGEWTDESLMRQWERGWTANDLQDFGGELRLGSPAKETSSSLIVEATPKLTGSDLSALESLVGSRRLALIFDNVQPRSRGRSRLSIRGLVAIRVLAVNERRDGNHEVIVQPTVLATRAALTEERGSDSSPGQPANPYLRRLVLSQ